jgi:fatty-acyl-CoA synthase
MNALSADAPTGSPLDSQPMPRGGHVLDDVLMRQVQDRPEALALQFEGRAFSYGRLARRTERAAARLWHPWGVRTGDRVAYLGLNHVDQITLLFALARIGAVLVPLNFRLAPAEWQAVLADCTPTCLLHDAAWADAAHSLGEAADLPVHGIDTLIATHAPGDAPRAAAPYHPALLVYTSGTTGRPKGAVHTQANLLANMAAACQAQALTSADVVLTVLPLFHVGGLCIQTLPALYAGASVLLHARFDPGATLASLAQERPTLTLQVPATMKALIEHPAWADDRPVGPARRLGRLQHLAGGPGGRLPGAWRAAVQCLWRYRDRAVLHRIDADARRQSCGLLRLAGAWGGGAAGRCARRRG